MRFKCPSCKKYQSPESLMPNLSLRDAVSQQLRVSEERKRLHESNNKQSDHVEGVDSHL
jgi:hypothetical protein